MWKDPGGGHYEHDSLCRRDELADPARRQLRAQPRQHPASRDEHVPHRADRQNPHTKRGGADGGDEGTEQHEQEGVDLDAQPPAEVRDGPGAPTVDSAHSEGRRGNDHQRGDVRRPTGVRDERRHAADEHGPGHDDPIGRLEALRAEPAQPIRQRGPADHRIRDPGQPPRRTKPGAHGQHDEKDHQRLRRRDQCPRRSHRLSGHAHSPDLWCPPRHEPVHGSVLPSDE